MATLNTQHIENILGIAHLAQECAAEQFFPEELFCQMTRLFESDSAVYYSMGNDLHHQPISDGYGYQVSANSVALYQNHYRTLDPCYQALTYQAHQGEALIASTEQAIDSDRHYINSEYYTDFLRPEGLDHCLIFGVGDQQGMLGLFGFHRPRHSKHYDMQDHLKARLFASQIATSLRLRQLTNGWIQQRAIVHQLMNQAGVEHYLLIDQRFNLIDSIGEAASILMLKPQFLSQAEHNLTDYLPPAITAYLHKLFQRHTINSSDTAKAFDNLHCNHHIRVSLLPNTEANPMALLVFLDNNHRLISQTRLDAFALTQREQELCHWVSHGLTTVQIAAQMGISSKTVEHHLTHIYRKTQVCNRTELLRQLSH